MESVIYLALVLLYFLVKFYPGDTQESVFYFFASLLHVTLVADRYETNIYETEIIT